MEIHNSFNWKNEYFFFTMAIHEQQTKPYMFPSNGMPSSDPEYLYDVLPDAITSFHCNNGILSKCFDLVSMYLPTKQQQSGRSTRVVSMPYDTKFRKRIGEVRLNLEILSETLDQWLIEVKLYFAPNMSQDQMYTKTNFTILSDNGTILTSSMRMTLQPSAPLNINMQLLLSSHFHLLDIAKATQDFLTSKYVAIVYIQTAKIIMSSWEP